MKGRKPLPRELRILTGNASKRRLNNPPIAPAGIPECPKYLNAEARKEWDRAVADLAKMGNLHRCDHVILEMYCANYSQAIALLKLIAKHGQLYVSKTREGAKAIRKNPAMQMFQNAAAAAVRYASELGLNPSTRMRLDVLPPIELDSFDRFMNGEKRDA